jgi:predicted O-methyltransferase YrrM
MILVWRTIPSLARQAAFAGAGLVSWQNLRVTYAGTATLLQTLSLACGARRILEIGTGDGHATRALAATLASDGMMITMEMDAGAAGRVREQLAASGHGDRVSVMVGDATRFLHKIAGPFDLIFQDSDPAKYDQVLDRLIGLLRPGGLLVSGGTDAAGDETQTAFNARLSADTRLHTAFLPVDGGVAVSVKRAS